jgi:hypothetical protein
MAAAVLLDARGRTLLVRRNGGLFSGMWQFPAVEVKRDAPGGLGRHLEAICGNGTGGGVYGAGCGVEEKNKRQRQNITQRTQRHREHRGNEENWEELEAVRHSVTFREVTLLPHLVRVEELPRVEGARVARLAQIERLPVSSATRKIALAAMKAPICHSEMPKALRNLHGS